MPGLPGELAERLGGRAGQVTAGATLVLAFLVWRFGKPWYAALVLTAALVALEMLEGTAPVPLLLRGLVILVLSAAVFWAIERSGNFFLALALAIAAVGVLLILVR